MPAEPADADIVTRAQATIVRRLTDECTAAELDTFVTDVTALPADHPDRAGLAAAMLMALPPISTDFSLVKPATLLLPMADADPPSSLRWTRHRAGLSITATLYTGAISGQVDIPVAMKDVDTFLPNIRPGDQAAPAADLLRWMLRSVQAMEDGNASVLQHAPEELAALRTRLGDQPELASALDLLELTTEAMHALQRDDVATAREHLEQINELAADVLPAELLPGLDGSVQHARNFEQVLDVLNDPNAGAAIPADVMATAMATINDPNASGHDRAMSHLVVGAALIRPGSSLDDIEDGVEHFRAALRLSPPDTDRHAHCLHTVALGLFRRSEEAGTVDGLPEVAELLATASDVLGGPRHPLWTFNKELAAGISARLGDLPTANSLGATAQRGYAWRALLESDATSAKHAVGDAVGNATELARRCVQNDDPAGALRALDTGRGLMLFAATELADIPARLAAIGAADLADRWTSGPHTPELRREALTALMDSPAADALLTPPDLAEIRAALTTLTADALIYLVPAGDTPAGLAVIAPADGPLAWFALPQLRIEADDDIENYLAVLADRPRDLSPQSDGGTFADRLDVLCDWAWRAAMGPILERYFTDRPPKHGREPRIVLVPMGDLARVPWQAARRGDGRYAVELAEISYAVSARLLCANARLTPVPASAAGLIVGDPDTGDPAHSLTNARLEAHAIRGAHYPGAKYLGRRPNGSVSPSGPGTTAQVRTWLTDHGPTAGTMAHFACHGVFTDVGDEALSSLRLAIDDSGEDDDKNGTLNAAEILDLLTDGTDRQLGLVVLAACNTGRSVHGYDEAYSLGTTFLAGRTRSVLSTLWRIPDEQTPSLMYLFHHYRRHEHLSPRRALRKAQLWLLDPGRRDGTDLPTELRASVPAGEPAPLGAWAGFIHYGQ